MPASQRPRPPTRAALLETTLVDGSSEAASRLVDNATKGAISAIEDNQKSRNLVTATLTAGKNVINHGLGRAPTHLHVTLSVPDATFSAALTTADAKQATVTTVGSTAVGARLEFA